tara:strand:+ start:13108 stop:14727 length:1620 start_codon:yes stop_codon:yes gene_type:complete
MLRLNQKRLRSLSRDRDFLVRSSIGIIAASTIVALIIWFAFGSRQDWYEERVKLAQRGEVEMLDAIREAETIIYREMGEKNQKAIEDWPHNPGGTVEAASLPKFVKMELVPTIRNWIGGSELSPESGELFETYARARYSGTEAERRMARAELTTLVTANSRRPFVNECVGDLEFEEGQFEAANRHFETELEIRESAHAASRLVETALVQNELERLRELLAQPKIRRSTSVLVRFEAFSKLRDYAGIFETVLVHDYAGLSLAYVGLTFFVAMVWFFIVGQFSGFRSDQLLIYGAAILLGVFSATLTLFVVIVQEEVFGLFPENGDFVQGLINNVAGIGLREEFIKLVCFIPLIPALLRRSNPVEALVVAGFVGLGFAVQENLSYYSRSGGNATVARFLSANFFHLAMTGLVGYAAYRFAQLPQRRWEELLATFLTVVLAHGIYDALLTLPEFMEHSWLSLIVFAVLAYRFFGVAHSLPLTWRQELSPLGIFVIGTSLLIGVTLNVVCYGEVPYPGYVLFLLSCVQLVPTAFIFINTFRSS